MYKGILKPSSKAQNSFWIKSHMGEDMGQFSARSINKVVPSFRNRVSEYVKSDGRTFWAFFSTQSVHTYIVCAVLNSWDNF